MKLLAAAVTALAAALALAGPASAAGTIRVDFTSDVDYIDPALAFFTHSEQVANATCAKLVNYEDTTGAATPVLVPEVAAAMPTISPDGRTYTFQIRKGFRFSPPASAEEVTAATFEFVFERLLHPQMQSPAAFYFDDIAGAAAYRAGTAASISGIVASGSTLSITLTEPAGDFLARLAMSFTCAVPVSTPITPLGVGAPLAGAGPFYVAEWVKNSHLILLLNPNYGGSRDPKLDRIEIRVGVTPAASRTRVESGASDVGYGLPADAGALNDAYGPASPWGIAGRQRFHVVPLPVVWYLPLNTERPAFADVNLRKAVNFALNRNTMAAQHGFLGGVATDQMLPGRLPGFTEEVIYPAGGDLAEALEHAALAGVSPTSRIAVTMYTFNTAFGPAIADYVKTRLADIGIDVTVQSFDRVVQNEKMGTRGEPFDIGLTGWGADYFDPFNFLDVLFHGSRIQPTNNLNQSYFDDATFNTRLDDAGALTGPTRLPTYGDIDVDLMRDAAAAVPYVNTTTRAFTSRRAGCIAYGPASLNFVLLCINEPVRADFAGDAVSDLGVWRPSSGAWHVQGQSTQWWGLSSDVAVPGDYDGDGDTDRAVWRPSSGGWFVQGQGTTYRGLSGDLPVPADYDGDGTTDTAVWRPGAGGWYVEDAPTVWHGRSGDVPVPADYDGDGDADRAVWRPEVGGWHVHGQPTVWLGRAGDVPVPADYDGDGDDDPAVWRPSTGAWFVLGRPTQWLGLNGDIPAPAQYVGDQQAERAVFRPSTGAWYVEGQPVRWLGAAGDHPLALPPAVRLLLFP